MDRAELALTCALVATLLAGAGFEAWRGAGKGAEVTVIRGSALPFDETGPAPEGQTGPGGTIAAEPPRNRMQPADLRALAFLNAAGQTELTVIPGVGDVTAGRIVSYRNENGPFRRPEELIRVDGVGERKLETILGFLRSPPSTPTPLKRAAYAPRPSPSPAGTPTKVSLNRATAEQLMAVSGIGPALAGAIIEELSLIHI